MKLENAVKVSWIADYIDARVVGDPNFEVTGLNEIHKVRTGDLTFVDLEKYYERSLNSAATVILLDKEVSCPEGKILLVSDDPFSGYVKLVKHFHPFRPSNKMISDSAIIGEGTAV